MAGNPNWQKGGASPNPNGRRKTRHSVRTPKGMIENFIKRNLSLRQLQRMYDELDSKDQFKVLTELLPYVMPKQTQSTIDLNLESLTDKDLDALYERVTNNITHTLIPSQSNLIDDLPTLEFELIKHSNGQEAEDNQA